MPETTMFDSRSTDKPYSMEESKSIIQQISALVIPENPFVRQLPMDKKSFFAFYHDVMTQYEIDEV